MSANPDPRQPILPFRFRPYRNMLALSVGLCIFIPVLALIIYGLLWGLGYLALFLSWTLGIIVSSVVIGLAFARNDRAYDPDSDNSGYVLAWLLGTCLISYFTYRPLLSVSDTLLNLTTVSWKCLMMLYENSGIVYWSWIPIGLMILYGVINLIALLTMKLLDWRPHWGRIRFICPHENCGAVTSSLVYKCPNCGETLEKLYPSRYGIFTTQCPHCKASIRTSWLNGRNQYSKTCPDCQKSLDFEGFGNVPESVFIVEGASKSGKTSFLIQALNLWNIHFGSLIRFSDSEQERSVRFQAEQIESGRFCAPTPRRLHPEAYVMHGKKAFGKFLAYFYDTGGDSTSSFEAGMAEPYYNLANGVFLVIDPWAEKGIVTAAGKRKKPLPSAYTYASQDANAVIGALCNKLERVYPDSFSSEFDIPVCVVVTKCDLNRLKNAIGTDADGFTQSSEKWVEHSRQVEKYLLHCGMYNFVNIVKTRFKKSAFFAVSVLDDDNNNSDSVLNPLLWMTYNAK
ncbi:MAG: hypothetical protein IKS45_13255 [Thermoguttaceae bacterium]|nr:hypothetical protein [Thermoguttaceae bacterium]